MKIIQFNLGRDFEELLEKNAIPLNSTLCEIENIMKKYDFINEINGIYKSNKANSVSAILAAQTLIKQIPYFKESVKNFKMYHVDMEDSFKQLTI